MSVYTAPHQPPEVQGTTFDAKLPIKMQQLADRIRLFDEDAANRMIAIATQLPDGSNPSKSIDHLLNLDLYQAVNPDTIEPDNLR